MSDHRFLTVGGRVFDLWSPSAADIDPHELAHALSLICRYAGHVRSFYSVAQHSLLVADLVAKTHPELELPALLHDAPEGLGLGDAITPLKRAMRAHRPVVGSSYDDLEARAAAVVAERFGFEVWGPHHEVVKRADLVALWAEMRDLRGPRATGGMGVGYHRARGFPVTDGEALGLAAALVPTITPMSPDIARGRFLRRLASLRPDLEINPVWEPEP